MISLEMFRAISKCLKLCELCIRSTSASISSIQCKPSLQFNTSSVNRKEYTLKQQNQILQVLNESTAEQLSRFAVSKQRAIILSSFRTENGSFQSLDQVLQLRTFGEHMLTRLYDSILVRENMDSCEDLGKTAKKAAKATRSRVQLVVPTLDESRRIKLASVVGIYVGLNVISWANIDRSTKMLTHWDLFHVDTGAKKLHPTNVFETVLEARMEIPDADIYVMEDSVPPGQSASQQVLSLSIELHKSQLSAMLLATLNTTTRSLDNACLAPVAPSRQRVFYLRARSTARLFGTLVGSERVSAHAVTQGVFERSAAHSPVEVGDDFRRFYSSQDGVGRENLSQSLLTTMAFMDLVVDPNPAAVKAVTGR